MQECDLASRRSSRIKRLQRCEDWLASQEAKAEDVSDAPPEIETNEDAAGIAFIAPTAVDEDEIKPRKIARRFLRTDGLRIECEWISCNYVTGDYDGFQKHVRSHIPKLLVVKGPISKYKCLWDICGHQSADGPEMTRHMNYHAYHSKLMAVGANAQFNLKLKPCQRDSTKRNKLPVQAQDYRCHWVDCAESYTAIQDLFSHLAQHIQYSEGKCSWAGCGTACESYMMQHVRSHSRERIVACPHCGMHMASNVKLQDHLQRQNIPANGGYACGVCGRVQATQRLLRAHARQHVCVYLCTYCDMTSPTLSALSLHIRYRHLSHLPENKPFKCDTCGNTFVTKSDLTRHAVTHGRTKKTKDKVQEESNEDDDHPDKKPKKISKKYICHMCPDGSNKIFSRGTRLTTHLVKGHGAQWPDGHCRFRYQKSKDGLYRLTTTRYESLEVSRQIMRGSGGPKGLVVQTQEVRIKKKQSATKHRPTSYAVDFNSQDSSEEREEPEEPSASMDNLLEEDLVMMKEETVTPMEPPIEITVCDVDEDGNVIKSEIIDMDKVIIGM